MRTHFVTEQFPSMNLPIGSALSKAPIVLLAALLAAGCGGSSKKNGGIDDPDASSGSGGNNMVGGGAGSGGTAVGAGGNGMPSGGSGGVAMMMMGGQPSVDGGPDTPGMGGMGGMAGMGGGVMSDAGADAAGGCSTENSACQLSGKNGLCRSKTCVVCADITDDATCKASYGAGSLCIAGACIDATCRNTSECSNGQLCTNNKCATCTTDVSCGSGKLCIAGACQAANCRADGDCQTGQLCKANQCTACAGPADDSACAARYGSAAICNAGVCKDGCRSQATCAGGQICNASNVCAACTSGDNALCVQRYGATSVCSAGACSQGTCATDAACGGGTVCENGMCATCGGNTGDARCQARYGNNNLCISGSCVVANCRADSECSNGQLCVSNVCSACTDVDDDSKCAAVLGAGNICKAGKCQTGCRTNSACSNGQLCQNLVCAACASTDADDAACSARYTAGDICKAGTCQAGCRTDASCSNGQLCKSLSCAACTDVTDDAACATKYGDGNVCLSGACKAGCRTAQGCLGNDTGKLCSAQNACTACTEDNTGDAACTAAYNATSVCSAGVCVPGDCRTSSDCIGQNNGQVCTNNKCTACASNSVCQGDAVYGAATICNVAAGAKQGQCVSASCGQPSASCSANPTVNYCCAANGGGNSCVTGNCCKTADCQFGQICTNNQCVLCTTVTDGNYYVDPLNGSDTAGVTGNGTCAWKTISYALLQLAASNQTATINVKATGNVVASATEVFPIGIAKTLTNGASVRIVPANRIIRGAGTDVPTIKVPAGNYAFAMAAPNSRVSQMIIESANLANKASFAIRVFQGSDDTTVIDHLTIRNTLNASIRLERNGAVANTASGVLTVQGGLNVTGAGGNGAIHVLHNGKITLNAGPGPDAISLSNNTYGIVVTDRGQVTATGVATWPLVNGGSQGTFVIKGNTTAGLYILPCVSVASQYSANQVAAPLPAAIAVQGSCSSATLTGLGTASPANSFDGIAVWDQNSGTANGVRLMAGANVKIRNSVILGSARSGVYVENGPTATIVNAGGNPVNWTYTVFDLATIDLGTAGSGGGNVLQAAQGSGLTNKGAGVQMAITNNKGQTLNAVGNTLQDAAIKTQTINCSTTSGTVSRNYPTISTCQAGDPQGGISACGNLTGATPNKMNLSMCTVP